MLKYAFIINVPGQTPETYSAVYENSESYNVLVGSDNMDMAEELVKKYVADGFTLFNLCGDFDDEITAKLRTAAGEGIKIVHSDYLPEELAKLEAAKSLLNYGIIIKMNGVEEPVYRSLKCDDCIATAVFVKDMDQSTEVAAKLAADGIDFIELCSWYDEEKTKAVSEAAGGRIAVGSCGL